MSLRHLPSWKKINSLLITSVFYQCFALPPATQKTFYFPSLQHQHKNSEDMKWKHLWKKHSNHIQGRQQVGVKAADLQEDGYLTSTSSRCVSSSTVSSSDAQWKQTHHLFEGIHEEPGPIFITSANSYRIYTRQEVNYRFNQFLLLVSISVHSVWDSSE